jgi:ribonuclease G
MERAAFLHVADMLEHRKSTRRAPIEKIHAEGQPLMVQVLKDPMQQGRSACLLSCRLAGRLLVYLPQDPHIGVSQRIDSEGRVALRDRLKALVPPDEKGGFDPAHSSAKAPATPSWRRHRVPAWQAMARHAGARRA